MNVLLLLNLPENVRTRYPGPLREAFPTFKVDLVHHHSQVDPFIGDADILITLGAHMADHVLEKGRRLKWIQALGTGVDGIIDRTALRKDVVVTNMHGLHGESMSEAAIMLMLALARDLPRSLRSQSERKWDRFPARTLKDRTVGIFGLGVIAEALAPMCKALGMTVIGITSAPRDVAGFDRVCPRDDLERVARELDFLVLLTPYTQSTRGIVNAKVIAALKPSSCLVNLARGGVVDEDALLKALQDGRLAGAALDVFGTEPLPSDHPFWSMQNVIVTPHLGGFFDGYPRYALPVVEENLRKFLAGDLQGMINIVKR